MNSPAERPAPEPGPPEYRNEGIRTLLAMFDQGDPEARLLLGDILRDLQQSAFGVFLFVAILPAFIPLPGVAGAVSGPLILLIGAQMLFGMRRPWLPGFVARRGPKRGTMHRFLARIDGPLRRLDRLLKPRLPGLLAPWPAHAFTGLLLILTALLLSLPIPFTNYLFGFQLLLFSLALLERDGVLMLLNWIGAIAAVLFFGLSSGQLVSYTLEQFQRWF
ncbi:exopolysaccharide biosynthesis protein [Stenotrophomonas rhizophila]|uniref:exopolysaccharide biosynthesis protein n=1 Tax=Stenotrophomonas rhizophila TaxID=216778 RepID=UPI001E49DA81|nr:exopolysaccharide biosynthesis protein [Stenotrophomonas rhizophila]MCC7635617.1 exopolysaccharide biosynthesis protein [Stenotrophomonas rhizophila]MCC7665228.1 exopolysaccharide biosynthesis protein [Stenotrophomonas rhizophila]